MSHYKPYPAYKDSGVDWVGQVPAHWDVLPLRVVASVNDDEREPFESDREEIRYVDISTVSLEDGIGAPAVIAAQEAPSRAQRKAKAGDVVLSTVRTYLRAIGQVKTAHEDCVFSTGFAVIRAGKKLSPEFLYSGILSEPFLAEIEANSKGVSYPAINASEVMLFKLPLPPKSEQERIAAVLADETTRIDALVQKKARFIELLREKRQALITHAVTKGLDPNAPMKDSGVEWLGQVPEHWTVLSFQRCVYIAEGQVNPEEEPYSSMMLVAPNHIESGTGRLLYTETATEQMAESGKYLCRDGDVIYSKIRPALRKACIAPADCLCSADMYPLRGDESLLNHYLLWFLLSEPFSAFAVLEADRVAMPKINRESLNALKLALPPVEEQATISRKLRQATTRIDAVIEKTERSIELLKERRSALITAAVTGQIDLRDTSVDASQIEPRKTA